MTDEGWVTKAVAATILGVDERTIERRARAGRIGAKAKPGFPTLYRAADVEMLRQTTPGEVQTGVLEGTQPASSNGHGAVTALATRSAPTDDRLVDVLRAILGALTHGPTGPTGPTTVTTGPTRPTLSDDERAMQFVTLPEAAAIKGRTATWLKRKIADGTLKAEKDRGWRIRRKDLEAL